MYYLYERHEGGFFTLDRELSEEELFCDYCMDSDELIATFRTGNQLRKLLKKANTYDDYIEVIVDKWRKIYE